MQSTGQVATHRNEERRSIKHDNEQKKAYNWTGVNRTENGTVDRCQQNREKVVMALFVYIYRFLVWKEFSEDQLTTLLLLFKFL